MNCEIYVRCSLSGFSYFNSIFMFFTIKPTSNSYSHELNMRKQKHEHKKPFFFLFSCSTPYFPSHNYGKIIKMETNEFYSAYKEF